MIFFMNYFLENIPTTKAIVFQNTEIAFFEDVFTTGEILPLISRDISFPFLVCESQKIDAIAEPIITVVTILSTFFAQ